MINVVNMRTYRGKGFRVDRTTPLGNPHYMNSETQRDQCCEDYRETFYKRLNNPSFKEFNSYLQQLITHYKQHGELTLMCWCAPKRCHAEVIKEYIESL